MMNNLKIRQKFLILGTVAFIFLILLAWLSLNINNKGFNNLSQVLNDFTKVHKLQGSYIEPLFTLREKNLTLVMSPNKQFKEKANKSLMEDLRKLDEAFKEAPKRIYKQWVEYKQLLLITREYALKSFDEGAFMNATTSEREAFYAFVEELKKIQKQSLEHSQETYTNAKKSTDNSRYFIIIGFLFVGISSFVFDFSVIRRVVNSIEKVQTGLSHFFEYLANPKKISDETYIDLKAKDELGLMAKEINRHINLTQQALNNDYQVIKEATSTVNELKDGKFGNRLTCKASSTELNTLKNVMNDMIDNLENKIQEEITQRTNQEKLLVQQSKLAAMGNMLGNIAHQWRQPISEVNAILMEVEAVARYSKLKKSFLLEKLSNCYEVTEHMSQTIADFQNFFKPSKKKEFFSVNEACNSAICVVAASLKFHNINLTFNIDEEHKVYGYPREFAHAILNILSNAKDILVERKIEEPQIFVSIKKGKEYSVIRIEDNAGGIENKNRERIFEPYFTTKHATQGTGIGLYMTKMIVENSMNGHISVENSKIGALFTIKIHQK